ncbi:hypothetical protein [Halorussus litoreus]|uniref:hypothetical protein n=1 Tax=Halorussus litoreus TaxID=1710536 RepID=UPI000E27E316|nr:hypothetical protein [Halorussus litoreus]
MGDSRTPEGPDGVGTHRDIALKLLQLDLAIAAIFVAGITFGVGDANWESVEPFLNGAMVLGCVSIVVSTVLALLVVVEITFTEAAAETGWVHDHLAGLVGVTVVVTGWSLPLFATGVVVGLHGSWDLPAGVWQLVGLMVVLHAVPTWYVLRRSYFARFGYPSGARGE